MRRDFFRHQVPWILHFGTTRQALKPRDLPRSGSIGDSAVPHARIKTLQRPRGSTHKRPPDKPDTHALLSPRPCRPKAPPPPPPPGRFEGRRAARAPRARLIARALTRPDGTRTRGGGRCGLLVAGNPPLSPVGGASTARTYDGVWLVYFLALLSISMALTPIRSVSLHASK